MLTGEKKEISQIYSGHFPLSDPKEFLSYSAQATVGSEPICLHL